MALTKRDVDRFAWNPDGPSIQLYADGEIPGLNIRVYPTGKKAFVLRYRPEGAHQPRMLTLGAYGVLTLPQARDLARKALVEAKTGTDPVEKRRRARQGETVRDFAAIYLERHAKKRKESWIKDERRLNRYILPAFGSKKLADVKRADVARLHSAIGDTRPYEANRVIEVVAILFAKAVEWGALDEAVPNPAARIQRFKEKSRDRWVTPDELPRLVEAINADPNIYVRAALKLYLLTGLRKNELLGLRWEDVDLTRREIRLADTKAGRPHLVPLSAPALEIIRAIPRQLGNAHVFVGIIPGRPLVSFSKSWTRIRKHAGLEDVRLHDLRRTVGSWMATSGASLPLIGKVLNHSNASTAQIYARLAEDATRTALEEHGARIGPMLTQGDGR